MLYRLLNNISMNIQHTISIFRYCLILSFITICDCFEVPLTIKNVVTSKTPIVNIPYGPEVHSLILNNEQSGNITFITNRLVTIQIEAGTPGMGFVFNGYDLTFNPNDLFRDQILSGKTIHLLVIIFNKKNTFPLFGMPIIQKYISIFDYQSSKMRFTSYGSFDTIINVSNYTKDYKTDKEKEEEREREREKEKERGSSSGRKKRRGRRREKKKGKWRKKEKRS